MRGLVLLAFSAALLSPAQAQSTHCNAQTPAAQDVASTMASAQALKDLLNQREDSVVVLARQGQKMDRHHLSYSHAAWAVRQPNGHWQIYHNLNECGTAHSSLYVQGLYEFLSDGLVRKEIALLRPTVALQERLLKVLANTQRLNLLHSSRYNLAAYPFSGAYQNSNGWLLEVFALANEPNVWSRNDARGWLKAQHYQPSELDVGFAQRTAANLFTSNISTSDQPVSLLDRGKIQLNSGDSVIRFIARYSQPITDCSHQGWGETVCIFSPPIK
ncbi:DUF2145 domain-containing protein [Serratia sp. (in: enterobacteria)]|uniref:DUF2145 domain-containing protein n=1 Tax=Serratia sp. (in: enterobacteria) TaxID=616 RepID=UPI003988FA06